MAKISTYANTPPPTLDDFLLGTDVNNNNATQNFLVSDLVNLIAKPYKVFTALLTQSGGSDMRGKDSGILTIGVTYQFANPSIGIDFSNVGAPNNNVGTYFIATGTTPNSWGEAEGLGDTLVTYDLGAPTATVLENTIGNVWFTYGGVGQYFANSSGLFTINKTFFVSGFTSQTFLLSTNIDDNQIGLSAFDTLSASFDNNLLYNTPIEIRIYN